MKADLHLCCLHWLKATFVMIWLKYIYRSGSIGYGKPPADAISTVVIIIISVGLGLPVVLILAGGIYVCAKKKDPTAKPLRNVQDEYQPIPNGKVDS